MNCLQVLCWRIKHIFFQVQSNQGNSSTTSKGSHKTGKLSDVEIFSGFKPAIEACYLDWEDYPIPGVTYGRNPKYVCPFTVFRHPSEAETATIKVGCGQVNSSQAVLRCEFPGVGAHRPRSGHDHRPRTQSESQRAAAEGAAVRSSLSSEEVPSDEGVDDAPSQSEGEGAEGLFSGFNENSTGPKPAKLDLGEEKEVGSAEKRGDESSPERDLESDWSSGQSENLPRAGDDEEREVEIQVQAPVAVASVDYQVYFYDPKVPVSHNNEDGSKEDIDIFKNLRKIEDPWEILFMRAEGIHAHGYQSHACEMAVSLALDMLKNPPDLITDAPPISFKGKKRRVCAASHQITHTASTTLTHCAFICTVLSETAQTPNHLYLAFQIGMFGLEMARPPASTKPMEVKLAHQESELVSLLKRLPLGPSELSIVRERAVQIKEGSLRTRGEALLPLMLASFILESLVLSPGSKNNYSYPRHPADELMGFEAAVAAIGLKANVSEADHPLLCEGTRRQKGDLTLSLLVTYKDDPERLAKIMDKLLDKDIHQMCKTPLLPNFYTCRHSENSAVPPPAEHPVNVPPPGYQPAHQNHHGAQAIANDMANLNLGARPRDRVRRISRENQPEAARRLEGSPPPDWDSYKAWEAKFRCTNLRTNKPRTPGHHMASIDSSAPETASSDNSPTLIRRIRPPPSDSGSSGNSSDSSGSRMGRPRLDSPSQGLIPVPPVPAQRLEQSAPNYPAPGPPPVSMMEMSNLTRTTLPNIKVTRFKGKRAYPSIPNQPSEASAHFMFELAKTVLSKAGGTSTTSLFTQPTSNQNPRGPQRALHMCAFQIGLYALGLHNRVSPNWISRTYSSHVSWITGQAMEIGATAIKFLIGTWEGHLTPPEAANIADRASRGRDSGIVAAAAELALSCLSHAHALNPNEIAKAILQCKEQSDLQLEKACLAVEEAARGGGVYPEVMFTVARHWYELWKTRAPGPRQEENRHPHGAGVPPPAVSEANVNHHMQQFQPPVSTHQIPGIPLAGNHMQVGMQFPIYSLIHGYPNSMPPQIPLQMQMYVGHPHHPMLSGLPVSQAHQGGYAQFPGLAGAGLANMPGMHMFPNVTTAAGTHPPYNMAAGGPLFQLAAMSNIQGMQMPLMPNPPTSQHMQQGVPLMPHPAPAASPLQPPGGGGPPPTSPANHAAVNGNVVYQRYLLSSFRVGMLALETLGRRVSEDRPQNKFTRNPSYADDVKWLLNVAKKIGLPYLQNFLMCVMATVVSPYLLQVFTIFMCFFVVFL